MNPWELENIYNIVTNLITNQLASDSLVYQTQFIWKLVTSVLEIDNTYASIGAVMTKSIKARVILKSVYRRIMPKNIMVKYFMIFMGLFGEEAYEKCNEAESLTRKKDIII